MRKIISFKQKKAVFPIFESMIFQNPIHRIILEKTAANLDSPKKSRYSFFYGVSRLFQKESFPLKDTNSELSRPFLEKKRKVLSDITLKRSSLDNISLVKPLFCGRLPIVPGCDREVRRLDRECLLLLESQFLLSLLPEERYDILVKPDVFFKNKLKVLNKLINHQDQENAVPFLKRTEKCRFLIKRFINFSWNPGSSLSNSASDCFKHIRYSYLSGEEYTRHLSVLLDDGWFNLVDKFKILSY